MVQGSGVVQTHPGDEAVHPALEEGAAVRADIDIYNLLRAIAVIARMRTKTGMLHVGCSLIDHPLSKQMTLARERRERYCDQQDKGKQEGRM